ncbi:MAG: hypothetical protein M1836_008049 [Candelina mexicana]|nr:MAG: hypothetical protein M1836_008049 [Candelina mexicana]
MPKRKRHQPEAAQYDRPRAPRAMEARKQQAEAKIVHGIKLLNRALKIAKGFERQKLGRRQKAAKEKNTPANIVRLDAEVEALKNLEFPVIAETHLIKTLLRSKIISSSNLLADRRVPDARAPSNTQDLATMNVTARLFNSKPVKEIMKEVVNSIYNAIGVKKTIWVSKGHVRTASLESERGEDRDSNFTPVPDRGTGDEKPPTSLGNGTSILAVSPFTQDDDCMSVNSKDSNDHARLKSRIVDSSDIGSGLKDALTPSPHAYKSTYDHSKDLSLSPSPSSSASTPPPSKAYSRGTNVPAKGSTFIPSLMMGGYWSGSESAEEDTGTVDVAPRKNRRGQQARRAIWEKKYGNNAKHLKDQSRDQGWNPRSGAIRDTRRQPRLKGLQASGAHSDPIKPRPGAQNGVEKALHPSWIAAKKAKEKKQSAPFQGTKVVFDKRL